MTLQTIENAHWQVGILPETGASLAFGRVRYRGTWLDILRPTDAANYGNPSLSSSFIMLPWANRIRDGRFSFAGETHQLDTEGRTTASHGAVRKRAWRLVEVAADQMRLRFNATAHEQVNWPFPFVAEMVYRLEDTALVFELTLTNSGDRPFPAGFGHHPYFVRPDGENTPQVQIHCGDYFPLTDFMVTGPPVPVTPQMDFRQARALDDHEYNDLLTGCAAGDKAVIHYPAWNVAITMQADAVFRHVLLFTPADKPFFAVEPQTIANDGFNLDDDSAGTFVVDAGESQHGTVRLIYAQG